MGYSILNDKDAKLFAHEDVRGIGLVVLELIDQVISVNPKTLTLRNPEKWMDTEIINFLPDTSSKTLRELSHHPLLADVTEASFLIYYTERARHEVYIECDDVDEFCSRNQCCNLVYISVR